MAAIGTVVVANGASGSAAADRGARIAAAVGDATVHVRRRGRVADIASTVVQLRRERPSVVYAIDLAVVPIVAWALGARRAALVVDTGDAPAAFLDLIDAPRHERALARWLERFAYRRATAIVVRGFRHPAALVGKTRRVELIPDGVDLDAITPVDDRELRHRLGLDCALTVGISGRFTWHDKVGYALGVELVQALHARPDVDMRAVLIGDGPGIAHLRTLAGELGVGDRLHAVGRVPYDELARFLGLCDVCLLTQTNEHSSDIRTTGKLPVYLASGRYVVASRVGTAADVLPEEMLLDHAPGVDATYPTRLADRLAEIALDPARAAKGLALRAIAEKEFDYRTVAADAAAVVRSISSGPLPG